MLRTYKGGRKVRGVKYYSLTKWRIKKSPKSENDNNNKWCLNIKLCDVKF